MNELVSVIVPLYNSEEYIGNCIEHLLKQTYENIEIILIDDGSDDSSEYICGQYKKNDERICLQLSKHALIIRKRKNCYERFLTKKP